VDVPHDSSLALTLTNILLALLVMGAVLYVAVGPLRDWLAKLRRRRAYEAELNHDMTEMFPTRSCAAVAAPAAHPGLAKRMLAALSGFWHRIARGR
jgi:hypothetical protein